jgi:uncharacterized protein (TIGR02145 family)
VGSSSSKVPNCLASEFEDTRDGKCYKYETYNGRTWMSENLNYSANGTLGWCYVDGGTELGTPGLDGPGCDRPYGRVYTQEVAMNVCPAGWRLPSQTEWGAISDTRKMTDDFYVISGNFNNNTAYPPLGWKERCTASTDCNGFYWTSQSGYFYLMQLPGMYGYITSSENTASPTNDYFSVRCIMDESVSLPSSSSSKTLGSDQPVQAIDISERVEMYNGDCVDIKVNWNNQWDIPTQIRLYCDRTNLSNITNLTARGDVVVSSGCSGGSTYLPGCVLNGFNSSGLNEWNVCITFDGTGSVSCYINR